MISKIILAGLLVSTAAFAESTVTKKTKALNEKGLVGHNIHEHKKAEKPAAKAAEEKKGHVKEMAAAADKKAKEHADHQAAGKVHHHKK